MTICKLLGIMFLAAAVDAASIYPTTFPFEKENMKIPDLPHATPFDNTSYASKDNPGGYLIRSVRCNPYSDDRQVYKDPAFKGGVPDSYHETKPAGFRECGFHAYQQWTKKNSIGKRYTKNCTEGLATKGGVFKSAEVSHMIGDKQYCEKGSCCKDFDGSMTTDIQRVPALLTLEGNKFKVGTCSKLAPQDYYCAIALQTYMCIEQYKGKKTSNARTVTLPCHDVSYRYLLGCPLFRSTRGAITESSSIFEWEPQSYQNKLSIEELLLFPGYANFMDRVCRPYSYYYPDATVKSLGSIHASINAFALLGTFYMFEVQGH